MQDTNDSDVVGSVDEKYYVRTMAASAEIASSNSGIPYSRGAGGNLIKLYTEPVEIIVSLGSTPDFTRIAADISQIGNRLRPEPDLPHAALSSRFCSASHSSISNATASPLASPSSSA